MADFAFQLGVVGAGKMGGALIRALVAREQIDPARIIAVDAAPAALEQLAADCPDVVTTSDLAPVAAESEVFLIALKPQVFADALQPVKFARPAGQTVLSIMAGVSMSRIVEYFGPETPVIRCMPNVCCEVAQGAFGYSANEYVPDDHRALVGSWFNAIGAAEELPENLLDAVTGLSGSGPAFVATFIEALADGGVAAGLPRAVAQRLAAQTVLGAASWVMEKGGPAQLKDTVCSPAGTTITGLRALEARGLRSATIEAVVAAAERSRQLGG